MHSPRHRFVPLVLVLVLVAALGAAGCSGSDDPNDAAEEAATATATTTDFCVRFPARDANVMLEAVKDPQLAGNDDMTASLLEMGANGLVEKAPPSLKGSVERYTAAMRDWKPGEDLTADPAAQAAVEDINAWLAANCGPPTGSTPSRTGPPGTTG